jgi:hypothetical protein
MYYNSIILKLVENGIIDDNNHPYFKEEIPHNGGGGIKGDVNYWRMSISIVKTQETRGMGMTFGGLKKYFNNYFPVISEYLKFDDPKITDNTTLYVKFSGRGKNLTDILIKLSEFILSPSPLFNSFDIKYGIMDNLDKYYLKKIFKGSREKDILCHNESGDSIFRFLKKDGEWTLVGKSTVIQKFEEKEGKILTMVYLAYSNGIVTTDFVDDKYVYLIRKIKLDQLFSN